jgi:hypothetical protein
MEDDDESEILLAVSVSRPNYWTISVLLLTVDPELEPTHADTRAACDAAKAAAQTMLLGH